MGSHFCHNLPSPFWGLEMAPLVTCSSFPRETFAADGLGNLNGKSQIHLINYLLRVLSWEAKMGKSWLAASGSSLVSKKRVSASYLQFHVPVLSWRHSQQSPGTKEGTTVLQVTGNQKGFMHLWARSSRKIKLSREGQAFHQRLPRADGSTKAWRSSFFHYQGLSWGWKTKASKALVRARVQGHFPGTRSHPGKDPSRHSESKDSSEKKWAHHSCTVAQNMTEKMARSQMTMVRSIYFIPSEKGGVSVCIFQRSLAQCQQAPSAPRPFFLAQLSNQRTPGHLEKWLTLT